MDDHVLVRGRVKISLNGKVVYEARNLVVNAGLTLLALLLSGSGTVPGWMGVGDSGLTPMPGQVALQGTQHYRPVATKVAAQNTVTYSVDYTGLNGSTKSVKEFGLFNANVSGTMFCRFICPEITWLAGDTLKVDWTIDIGELG